MDKYKNKYRIPSARLQNWDYGANAAYFVTICTQGRECYFGEIVECRDAKSCVSNEMQLSEIGKIASDCWVEIPKHFPFVKLDAFIVMPNHVHGIIIINKPNDDLGDAINRVSTANTIGGITGNKNPMLNNNLSRIIRWYKGRVSFESRQIHADFSWQSRFYSLSRSLIVGNHIIRNDHSFQKISDYIETNPIVWQTDKFYVL